MDVKVPRLAEGVESATVANLLVHPGDRIEKDQVILELETEKAVGPIPSPASGKVIKIHVREGDVVQVGQLLLSLAEEGVSQKAAKERELAPKEVGREAKEASVAEELQPEEYRYESRSGFPPPTSPSIRKLARDLGIDLARVKGSERGGRIGLKDLRAYIEQLQEIAFVPKAVSIAAPDSPAKVAPKKVDFSKWGPIQKKRMSALRRTVGQRMYDSWATIPHITQLDEADITDLLRLRKKYDASGDKKGIHLTLTPFALKALVIALRKYPIFNSSLDESTGEIVYKDYYHLGVAVDTEAGLIVPVLRDVDKKRLWDLAAELNALVEKTRQRKISLEELQGGTFSISNQGGLGGGHFTPIINKPEVAVLGLGRAALKPIAKNGKMETRMMLPLCLSYDHRLIDGADAVRFMNELIQALEGFPEKELKG